MDAVERLLAEGGGDAVTMRAVAHEAGVSLRLVQYYGNTKDELLATTLDRLADKSVARWRSTPAPTALSAVETFLLEALPTDQASRDLHRVGVALEGLAITRPDIASSAYRRHLSGLADRLSENMRSDGSAQLEMRTLALEVMSIAHGLGTLLLVDEVTEHEAHTLIQDYLDRLGPRLMG